MKNYPEKTYILDQMEAIKTLQRMINENTEIQISRDQYRDLLDVAIDLCYLNIEMLNRIDELKEKYEKKL